MDDDTYKAMALVAFALSTHTISHLQGRGVLDRNAAIEIYDQALLNLEQNGPRDKSETIARQMLGEALRELGPRE